MLRYNLPAGHSIKINVGVLGVAYKLQLVPNQVSKHQYLPMSSRQLYALFLFYIIGDIKDLPHGHKPSWVIVRVHIEQGWVYEAQGNHYVSLFVRMIKII